MRRLAVLLLMGTLFASGSLEATAGGRKPRTHVVPYVGSAIANPGGGFNCAGADEFDGYPGVGCVVLFPTTRDVKVSARIKDASGLATSGWLVQNEWDGDKGVYTWSKIDRFCTETEEPVKIHPRTTHIFVALWQGRCLNGTPAASTTGEVTFTVWTS